MHTGVMYRLTGLAWCRGSHAWPGINLEFACSTHGQAGAYGDARHGGHQQGAAKTHASASRLYFEAAICKF